MTVPPKRRGSATLPRSKGSGKLKDKYGASSKATEEPTTRDERIAQRRKRTANARRGRSLSPTPENSKRRRTLDPAVLARGMTARCLGSKVQLSPLTHEECERDLRHMEAYSNACKTYSQQFFIHQNRALVQSGHYGPVTAPTLVSTDHYVNSEGQGYDPYRTQRVMPVRIDPEEEKRVSILRKQIASSEAQREVMETEYMSLRAHCVHECQQLRRSRYAADGQLKLLQDLVKRRGRVVALRRARCAIARDVQRVLEYRKTVVKEKTQDQPKADVDSRETGSSSVLATPDNDDDDVLAAWNAIETELREAEAACGELSLPEEIKLLKSDRTSKKRQSKGGGAGTGTAGKTSGERKKTNGKSTSDGKDDLVLWGASRIPRTPYNVPVLLSYMSEVPDKAAGFGKCGRICYAV